MTGPAPGAAPGLPVSRALPETFSTFDLPVPRRIELWEQHNAAALVGLDVRSGTPLQAAETSLRLPYATLARVRGSAHAVHRSPAAIDRDPCRAVAVYLPLRGEGSFRQYDSALTLRPGQALLCETDRPFDREFAHGLDELVVTVPRDALELDPAGESRVLRRPAVTAFAAADTAGAGSAGGAVSVYAAALARLTARATRAERPVRADERTIVELVSVLAAGPQAERARAHRAAARAFIEEHLTDSALGADQVAHAIGISERHLSRIFAADGTSLPRHVLARRLETAYAMLTSPPPRPQKRPEPAPTSDFGETVAAIATACGFTSVTYFSHAFSRRFGRRAGEILREARAIRRS
jgi:AraC-like DNA-binding protein